MSAIYRTEAGKREIEEGYRELLRRWPTSHEHVRVPTREGETFVVSCGRPDAPPLLLFHGSGSNAAMWIGDVAAWSEHFRVHAVDMIGEPGLSAPARPPLGSAAYALWLDDVLEGLGVTRASVVGTSLGGWLALDYSTRRPERVERLALLCPGGIGRQKKAWLVKAILRRCLGQRGIRSSLGTVLGIDMADPRMQADLEHLVLTFTQFKPRMQPLPVFDDDTLEQLVLPLQVIVGGRDVMFDSHQTKRRVERAAPHAQVLLLPEAGHFLPGQTATVLEFLLGPTARTAT